MQRNDRGGWGQRRQSDSDFVLDEAVERAAQRENLADESAIPNQEASTDLVGYHEWLCWDYYTGYSSQTNNQAMQVEIDKKWSKSAQLFCALTIRHSLMDGIFHLNNHINNLSAKQAPIQPRKSLFPFQRCGQIAFLSNGYRI